MSAIYTRRVSFDSLNPNIQVEPDEPLHIPPQYLNKVKHSLGQTQTNKRGLDLNFGYEPSSNHADLYKVFDSFQEINHKPYKSNYQLTRRKFPKLPPPPSKSILKRSHLDSEYLDTNPDEIPKSFNDNENNAFASVLPSQQRKKSLVEMTTEEILAMDNQYRTGSVDLNKFQFDGDNYLPFHNMSSIDSKKPNNGLPNIDKLAGNIVTFNNKKIIKPNSMNFKSFSVSFRQKEMSNYIQKVYETYEEENKENDKDEKELPESLRGVMVYISGRRHTWDSINWVLKNFLIDGDQLVIISQLPILEDEDDDDIIESDFIKEKADSLSTYIFNAIELLGKQDLKISISIEFIKDKNVGDLIKNSIHLYNPGFFLISSLISNRLTIKFDNGHVKLPYYLMKNMNISTIVIPDLLINKNSISLESSSSIQQSNIPIILEPEEINNGDPFLSSLNTISDAYKYVEQLESDSSNSLSNPITRTNSNSRSDSTSERAGSPTNYYPKIKFSDNLSIPRYNGSSSSTSPYSSRRNSNNSSGIYKVKSLLDEPTPNKNKIERTKSYNLTPITNSISNVSVNERRMSAGNYVKKSKSVDEGVPKKSGFLAKLGFAKKK